MFLNGVFAPSEGETPLQKKGLNVFLKIAEIELKTDKQIQEFIKQKKELEKELEKYEFIGKDSYEKERLEEILTKVNKEFMTKVASIYEFKVEVEKIVDYTGTNNKNDDYIREEMLKLQELSVEIRKDSKNWGGFVFFPILKREGDYFIFEVANPLKEQIVLGRGYTPLDLLELKNLSGKYAVVFYEILKMYDFKKEIKLELKEIRRLTGTTDLYNKKDGNINFFNWEDKVLKEGIEEVNEKTVLNITYEKIKYKGAIKWIEFKISKKENFKDIEDAEIKKEDKNISEEEKEKNREEYRETKKKKKKEYSEDVNILYNLLPETEQVDCRKDEIEELLKQHSLEYLKADIEYCKKKKTNDFWGYFIKSTKEGHFSTAEIEKQKKKEEAKRKRIEKEEAEKRKREEREKEREILAKELIKYIPSEQREIMQSKYDNQKNIYTKTGVDFERFLIENIKANEKEFEKLNKIKKLMEEYN